MDKNPNKENKEGESSWFGETVETMSEQARDVDETAKKNEAVAIINIIDNDRHELTDYSNEFRSKMIP